MDPIVLFSDAQALVSAGDTTSSGIVDTQALDPDDLAASQLVVKTATPLAFTGNGALQVLLQSSRDGVSWGVHRALTPVLTFHTTGAGQTLIAVRLPDGLPRYPRLLYRITGTPTGGSITAGLEQRPAERFFYGRSGFTLAE